MLIPIGTEIEHKRQPIVTYWIIGLNLLFFALHWATQRAGGELADSELIRFIAEVESNGKLSGSNFHLWSLVTYQFLHSGWLHLFGNMLFLLPFGKAVEDRMGHVLFALFYLGSGALGGLVHTLFYINPVVGASGSVCAVVTAFVVLAPKTNIKILLIFFIIGVYSIPSLLLVAFYVAFDTFSLLASFAGANAEPTAWLVHLIGYLTGFIFTISALSLGLISSSEFDVTNMIRQAYRRESFKKAIQTSPILLKNEEEVNEPEFLVRTSIAEAASSGNTKRATEQYFKAIEDYPKIKIDPRSFHIIGSSLLQENKIEQGALVFERYLTQYKNAKDKGEVALLLVAKYTRDLNNPSRAKALLKKYKSDFSEQHQQLASTMSKELQL